jgi:voltage-gated potassium channel
MSFKQKLYTAFYGSGDSSASLLLQLSIAALIVLNVFAVMLETEEPIRADYADMFNAFELFSVSVFALEYLARLWVSDLSPQYRPPHGNRLKYLLSPMALVDLLAIAPSLLSLAGVDLRVVRVIRLMRLLKMTRHSEAMSALAAAIKAGRDELVLTMYIMGILLLVSGTLIYFAEHTAQPQEFSSIPASLWWAVVTLTTIGYGDVYPITVAGKLIAGVSAIFGIGMIALPGGIIASELIHNSKRKASRVCPHCGKET